MPKLESFQATKLGTKGLLSVYFAENYKRSLCEEEKLNLLYYNLEGEKPLTENNTRVMLSQVKTAHPYLSLPVCLRRACINK